MKNAFVVLLCGLICVAIGTLNIWAGVLSLPILYSFAGSLRK